MQRWRAYADEKNREQQLAETEKCEGKWNLVGLRFVLFTVIGFRLSAAALELIRH